MQTSSISEVQQKHLFTVEIDEKETRGDRFGHPFDIG